MRAAPGVVQVTARRGRSGSGFVIDKAGHIVTNFGVVQGAGRVEVSFSNNERLPARIVGRDPSTDSPSFRSGRARARSRRSSSATPTRQVGDSVVAIGNPLGEDRSVTSGIVSALPADRRAERCADRPRDPDRCRAQPRQLGRAAPGRARPGDRRRARGRLDDGDGVDGFAIPINTVKDVAAQLIAKRRRRASVRRARRPRDLGSGRDAVPAPRAATACSSPVSAAATAPRRRACAARRRHVTLAGDHVAARRRHHRADRRRSRRVRSPAARDRRREETGRLGRARARIAATRACDVRVKLGRQPVSPGC